MVTPQLPFECGASIKFEKQDSSYMPLYEMHVSIEDSKLPNLKQFPLLTMS